MKVGDYLLIYRDRRVFYPLRRGKDGNGQIWTFDEYDDAERVATRVSNYTGKDYKVASVISIDEEYDRIFRGEYPTLICDDETVYPVAIV